MPKLVKVSIIVGNPRVTKVRCRLNYKDQNLIVLESYVRQG
ncbi:hypothetical protein SAMN04488513_103356 [Pseudozobellia thermophila]|uniref:Uncharacterized protein n=1 Tax=Pseudozobellia thermophila TaxID=192903 RepID=A0A1M6I736_9FLAO|nr:hypothetical protein SAMN04488513_103356 [Pseudozobellia thermophila]